MNRILFAAILLIVASIGSAQNPLTPTGMVCPYDVASRVYTMAADSTQAVCCYEEVDPAASATPTDCQTACAGYNYALYGYFRNVTYDSCVCLYCSGSVDLTSNLKSNLNYDNGKTPTTDVLDLAASTTFDVEADLNTDNSTQLTISPNQTAVIRTSTSVNGNSISFIAIPSVTGLPAYSTFGFVVRNLTDYGTSTESAMFRNNSFEISNLAMVYNPVVQYKRQVSPSDRFTYTMKNLGSRLFVVLSSGNSPLTSWYYEPVASYVDNTIVALAEDFTFNLELESSATMKYSTCYSSQCNNNTLELCQNQSLVARKYCPLGCDLSANDCIKCNSTNCQGTCTADSTCVCSDTQLGNSCEVDISTSTYAVTGGGSRQGDYAVPARFDITECNVGEVCGQVSYIIPDFNLMIITVSGSCCTATLRLTEIQYVSANTRTLQFAKESDWTCKQGDYLQLDTNTMDSTYALTIQVQSSSSPYGPPNQYNNWRWNDQQLAPTESPLPQCGTAAEEQSANKQIVNAVMPVSVTFMVVCCVAVAGGFVGGFFKAPRGLTVKKKHFKGCLPKSNAALSRSIIAIVCVDVGVVTTMNLVGALNPLSAMVVVSGILLAIMVFQYEAVASRFNNKMSRMYHMQKVERVFGRLGAAFLIIIGVMLILTEVVKLLPGFLSIISSLFNGIIGYFYLALFITWIFVAVHFAAAIYISVVFYYTAARTDEQESIEDHEKEEMSEVQNETEP